MKKKRNKKLRVKPVGFTLKEILGLSTKEVYDMIVKVNKVRYEARKKETYKK